jgi:hypothetical protein
MEKDVEMSQEAMAKEAIANGGVPKNFRQQVDMEAFYRFVNDNDLRVEALAILDEVRAAKNALKTAAKRVKH